MQTILTSLGYLALFSNLLIVYILFLLFKKGGKANYYLISFFAIGLVHQLLIQLQIFSILELHWFGTITISVLLLYPPTIRFYILAYFSIPVKSPWTHYLVLQAVYLSVLGLINGGVSVPQWLITAVYTVPMMIYFILTVKDVIKNWSILNKRNWTLAFLAFVAIKILLLVSEGLVINFNLVWAVGVFGYYVVVVSFISLILFALTVIYQIVVQPRFFYSYKPFDCSSMKPLKSEIALLEKHVIEGELFLVSDLTRTKVKEHTGLSAQRISEIVNLHYRKNFNEWINDLRIAKGKELLNSEERSIKEIYFEIGFSSKSVFNVAFKKRTGLTPSRFRSQLLSNQQL